MNSLKASALLLLPLLLLIAVSACATAPERSGDTFTLTGKTRYQGKSLASGEVVLMTAEPGGAVYRTAVREDGGFNIDLPSSPYLLMGSSSDPVSGKKLFAFWTNNPIRLHGNVNDPVVLPFVESTGPPMIVEGEGIQGRVVHEGKTVPGAVVAAFLDADGEFHGLPYAESGPSNDNGEFFLNVGPGRYFVLARSRVVGGSYQGPLLKGDLAGFYPHNPVILRTEEGLALNIPMVTVNRPRGEGSLAHGEAIIVEGKVRAVTGEAVPGVRVVLYSIPEMLGRPVFISSPTDESGSYRLEVSSNGKFYAAARSVIGRPPETGERMGFYDGTEDHSLMLEMGDRLEGVDIVVREVW
jgi:hypothetical protein